MSGSLETVRFADPAIGRRARRRVDEVLASGALAAGDEVDAFQREFAAFCGADRAVATSNGTTALHVALEAVGIGPGDRVVTPPFSFVASANAVRHVGATPVFADVDPVTYTLDPDAVDRVAAEGEGIDGVIAVHLYGLPAPVDALADLAADHDAALVEDAAQAHGAEIGGRRVGSIGDAGCFSFYPTKNMTSGEGGMLVTDRGDVADRAERLINHGRAGPHEHVEVGYNFRMTEMAAAIGRVQLERLPAANRRRRDLASAYDAELSGLPVSRPAEPDRCRHVYNQYTVRTDDRDGLRQHLESRGIESAVYYPTPIHQQPPYRGGDWSLPVSERLGDEVLSLPVHPGLTPAQRDRVVAAIEEWAG